MPQMRVAIVTETYMPQINGVSKTLCRLVKYFVRQGDEVKIPSPRYDITLTANEGVEFFAFRAVPFPFCREVVIFAPGLLFLQIASSSLSGELFECVHVLLKRQLAL